MFDIFLASKPGKTTGFFKAVIDVASPKDRFFLFFLLLW